MLEIEIELCIMYKNNRINKHITYISDKLCMSNIIDMIYLFAPRDCDIEVYIGLLDLHAYRQNSIIMEIVNGVVYVRELITYGGKIYDE